MISIFEMAGEEEREFSTSKILFNRKLWTFDGVVITLPNYKVIAEMGVLIQRPK